MTSTDSKLAQTGSGKNLYRPGLVFASRPTSDEFYDVDFPKKALVVVFNHIEYMNYENARRSGSEKDVEKLRETFPEPDYDFRVFIDQTSAEIRDNLDDLASENNSDISCLIIVMMTHGDRGGILYTYDSAINVDDLWRSFTGDMCPSLIGKPKLFFIQACRGHMVDPGALLESSNQDKNALASRSAACDKEKKFVIPALADILIFFSTTEGYYSYKCPETGSWFIQTLCDKFNEYLGSDEEVDLMRILTSVKRHVAYSFQAYDPGDLIDATKQMPAITTMLTKLYIFNKK